MPKSPEVSVVNYAGRFAFLEATLVEWPNLLHSLRSDVLPFVAAGEEAAGHYQHLRSFAALRGTRPVPKVFAAIQAWARVHNLSDEWILDAAVQTIAAWHLSNRSEVKWHYLPDDLNTPIFTPDFGGQWLPPVMNWSTFKTEMDGAYRKQLRAYRETVAKLWGDNKPHGWSRRGGRYCGNEGRVRRPSAG